jgi:membrane associated rhomboid family serine protease
MSELQAEPPAPQQGEPPRPAAEPAVDPQAFAASLRELTPRGFVTEALIGLNCLVFLVMVIGGVHPMEPKIDDLLRWGADYAPRTTNGQWWRLLTATFIHIGIIHLGMNMYVLWSAGRLVERLFGNVGFLVAYLAAGFAGSLASVVWNPYLTCAGASGAVFGVYGALLGFLVRQEKSIPQATLQALGRNAIVFLGYNLLYGMTAKGIDMSAHIGGLAGGFLAGLVLAHPLTREEVLRRPRRNVALAVGSTVVVVVATRFVPHPVDIYAEANRYDALQAEFNVAIREMKAHNITDEAFADQVESKILPEWRTMEDRLKSAKGMPEAQGRLVAALLRSAASREEAFQLVAEGIRKNDVALVKQANEKQHEADALLEPLKSPKP